jgi:hypothetical protein
MTIFLAGLGVSAGAGLYTSLWGAFKDSPYESFKIRTFFRSIWVSLILYTALFYFGPLREELSSLRLAQLFFLIMGVERVVTEMYKCFFRNEDQAKYLIPSRITFFGRHITDGPLRYCVGTMIYAATGIILISSKTEVAGYTGFLAIACLTGLMSAVGGAYKDAPFEGFMPLKFLRSPLVMAATSPFFYLLGPAPIGFLLFMNGGLERFIIEFYKTYIRRWQSGKFHPDLRRIQIFVEKRARFYYLAMGIISGLIILIIYELGQTP